MRVVFFGTSPFGLPALDALKNSSHTLLSIVTQPDRPSGRNLTARPSAVKEWATAHALPSLELTKENEIECVRQLSSINADVFIVISFGKLLKLNLLEMPKIAPLNVHASLLPRWRGASPMQSAILAGDAETGVGVIRMVEVLDAGDVLLEKRLKVDARETILTLEPKLAELGAFALIEALSLLEKGAPQWKPQAREGVTVCTKIKKENGRLAWVQPAEILDREVRAFLRWPGSFTFLNEKRIIVKRCRVDLGSPGQAPGRVLRADVSGVYVAAGQGTLVLEELQLEGRRAMLAGEFLKGFPLKSGDNLS